MRLHSYLITLITTLILSSCANSNFRTAHVVETGKKEIILGVSHSFSSYVDPSPVVSATYGLKKDMDIGIRYDSDTLIGSGRLQILDAKHDFCDLLISGETGYHFKVEQPHVGVGFSVGKRFTSFEPYFSYSLKHYISQERTWRQNDDSVFHFFEGLEGPIDENLSLIHIGSRYHFENTWFIGLELGCTRFMRSKDHFFTYGICFGKTF